MQGFNKYYPPDYNPLEHASLNAYRGKHALGNRAHKISQGILVTRFELPFNIWCGTCKNHIGMGVRYNAEKKKIGNYYSTPIFSFRCKCHLCDGYFEIHTDPKNTQYVVASGARRKDEDWDPEENGGFAIHDTDKNLISTDPLAALEKSTEAQHNLTKVQIPRLDALQQLSDHYNSDPYALSSKVRKRFRADKKVDMAKKKAEDQFKQRYGLSDSLSLPEDDQQAIADAKSEWAQAKSEFDQRERAKRRKLDVDVTVIPLASAPSRKPSSSKSKPTEALSSLRARILENTARHTNPFNRTHSSTAGPSLTR